MKLKICSIAIFALFCLSSKSQFRLGFQASGLKLPKSAGNYGTSFGPGIDFSYTPSEGGRSEFFFTGAYFLPSKNVTQATVYSGNESATATLTQKTSLIGLTLGGRYFFTDRDEVNFNPYATVNANMVLGNTKASYTDMPQGYGPGYNDNASGNTHQLMIGLGLGFEYNIGSGRIFAEAQYRFPTGTYNSRTGYDGDLQIPGHPWFSAGYRFSLSGD